MDGGTKDTMDHTARLQCYPIRKPVELLICVSDNLGIYKMKEGKACFHPVNCFDGFQEVFKMSRITTFSGFSFNI